MESATRTLQGTLEGSGSGFEWLKWHPRGHLIIAGSEDCNVWMWNADHNANLNTFAGHSSTVTCGDFTPDGKLICTGSDDASLRIWDPRNAQSRHVVRGHGYHTDGLTCLSITPDSQLIVSGSKDNSVHIVNITSGQAKLIGRGSVGELNCLPKLLLCVTILLVVNIVTNVVIDYQSLLSQKFGFASSKLLSAHISQIVCILLLDCCRWPMHLSYLIKDVFLCYRTVRRPQFSYFYPTL